MASLVIRDLPEHVMTAIEERAAAAGKSREEWLREQLTSLATAPVVRKVYALRAFANGGDGGTLQLSRWPDGSVEITKQHQMDGNAILMRDEVAALMQRNEPGDREAAMKLLREWYDQVFETSV